MRRTALLGLALALAACNGWPDLEPVEAAPGVLDAELGIELARTTSSFRVGAGFVGEGAGALVLIYEERGRGWAARRIDPVTLAVTELPAPPAAPGDLVDLARVTGATRTACLITHAGASRLWLLEDDWRGLPPIVDVDVAGATPFEQALVHDGGAFVAAGGRVWAWTGDAWVEPVTSSRGVRLGGFGDGTQWLVYPDETTALTAVPVGPDGVPGTPVVGPAVGNIEISAMNGDASAFQVVAGGGLHVVTPAGITTGDAVAGTPWSAPGSATVLVSGSADLTTPWTFAAGGQLGDPAVVPFLPMVDCDACPTDAPCGCTPHQVDFVLARPSSGATHLALVMVDALDGYAVLTARVLELPVLVDPFAP